MFSGIVETIGRVEKIIEEGTNKNFFISSGITDDLKIDQSISHNGVCLTVVDISADNYKVTAVKETLDISNIGQLKVGSLINLERSLKISDRLDGHIVQGHVDSITTVLDFEEQAGSWRFQFRLPSFSRNLLVYKGSICINGVSLTISRLEKDYFEVAIIPYTFETTNFKTFAKGTQVNIEFDILGKYIARYLDIQKEKS